MKRRQRHRGLKEKRPTHGDWILDPASYVEFWKDKPISVKLAIEDYLLLSRTDDRKYTLDFTTKHNEANWVLVKKSFQNLVKRGLIRH